MTKTVKEKTFINSPLTLIVEGVKLSGFRERLWAIFGRIRVAPGVVIKDSVFIQGDPIPRAFFARLRFCLRVLTGRVQATVTPGWKFEPAITLVDEEASG